jgi:protein TonB
MLRTLLESKATPTRRGRGTLISVAVHTGVIALAIAGTARAVAPPPADPPRRDTIAYVIPARPNESRSPTQPTSMVEGHVLPALQRVLVPVVSVPDHLPAIDLTRPPTGEVFGPRINLAGPPGGGPELSRPGDGVYTRDVVEKAVVAQPGNPAPVYPAALRSAQIEGEVVARFVVDTTGRAEPASISFPAATHPQFADAVRLTLLRSRYFAAMIGGRSVRQLVEQRFAFTLTR